MSEDQKYHFTGVVTESPTYGESGGKTTAKLHCRYTKTWATGSKDVDLIFEFYSAPADWLAKKNVKSGDRVRIEFELGNYKTFIKLQGSKVDVLSTAANRGGDDEMPD